MSPCTAHSGWGKDMEEKFCQTDGLLPPPFIRQKSYLESYLLFVGPYWLKSNFTSVWWNKQIKSLFIYTSVNYCFHFDGVFLIVWFQRVFCRRVVVGISLGINWITENKCISANHFHDGVLAVLAHSISLLGSLSIFTAAFRLFITRVHFFFPYVSSHPSCHPVMITCVYAVGERNRHAPFCLVVSSLW